MQKILRRGVKNTQKNYAKKDLNDPGNHDGVLKWRIPADAKQEMKLKTSSGTRIFKALNTRLKSLNFISDKKTLKGF